MGDGEGGRVCQKRRGGGFAFQVSVNSGAGFHSVLEKLTLKESIRI
jgi:hypothetical protein